MDSLHNPDKINSYFIEQIKDYAIFAMDTEGIITTWNKGVEQLKGYKENEFVGKFFGMLFPDEYQQADMPKVELKSALEDGLYETKDWRKRKDGSLFWATIKLTPIYENEKHIGFTKITGDITEQKELQDKLAERQQSVLELKNTELERINLDLDTFIYTASHDLHSPILNIEGLMHILKNELEAANALNSATEEILHRVVDSVNRFKRTIVDLTEINSMHKGLSESVSDEVITIKEVYEEIMADLHKPANLKDCFIHTDFQVNILKFSRKNFRSILYNLLSNAIKFQSPDRECIITLSSRLEEPYVVLSIRDNGMGINGRQQKELYTMFKRFHNHAEGTGIGLYMVKRILENAGGKIEVESEEDKGTEFRLYFPAEV
ncbi:PAS domain-containing sensor histidine kinase [Pontibacter sp. KCTC 32443]|uniref:sensor histidine kinase n=1 Tax=Pontibacter TaxID=323449 RepID=UPI00164D4680|nr:MULTISPECIES: PAS domain-containing sensor histidine kinase [Pontibacter]MBC5773058.1 PAS domain-containing sensor histidine kinase [Pontibacter sp. KCTC 32443]